MVNVIDTVNHKTKHLNPKKTTYKPHLKVRQHPLAHAMNNQITLLLQEKQRRSSSNTSTTSRPHLHLHPSFPQFPHLPLEIRLQIWEAALPPPQIIPITYCSSSRTEATTHDSRQKRYSIHHSKTLLPLLSTCVESRKVTLEQYHVYFGAPLTTSSIRVNLARDTIYLACSPIVTDQGMTTFIEALPIEVSRRLRYLAVDERVYNPVIDELPPFDKLPNLKGLTIVQHEDSCRRDWNDETFSTTFRGKLKAASRGELQFTNIVLPAVEEAMWDWIEQAEKEGRNWIFPRLKLVRLLVGGTRCCEIEGSEDSWLEEDEYVEEDDDYAIEQVDQDLRGDYIDVVQL